MIRENKKLPPDVFGKVPEIVEAISSDLDIAALFAFGSLAEGRLAPLSDLDFAVLLSKRLSRRQRFEKHLALIGVFNSVFRTDEIDLVLLNDAPLKFGHRILKTGKLLHLRNKEELVDFREKVVKLYLDFRFFRDRFDSAFLEGVGYHGGAHPRASQAVEPIPPEAARDETIDPGRIPPRRYAPGRCREAFALGHRKRPQHREPPGFAVSVRESD
jgi:predicted nucleotidyltransferase